MTKLVAFDLDGTLNMTHTYAVAAYQEALKELGAGPVAESVIRSRFGAPFRDDSLFFLGDDSEETFRLFYRAVERHWTPLMRERAQTYPGCLLYTSAHAGRMFIAVNSLWVSYGSAWGRAW